MCEVVPCHRCGKLLTCWNKVEGYNNIWSCSCGNLSTSVDSVIE